MLEFGSWTSWVLSQLGCQSSEQPSSFCKLPTKVATRASAAALGSVDVAPKVSAKVVATKALVRRRME
ncbi:hypothetical protein GCM10009638_02180 [Luteococcus sanguinis]